MSSSKVINLLWTGGWDSTYRFVELSRMKVTIQPIYCIDDERISKDIEQERMSEIFSLIKNNKNTKAKILPLKKINIKDIKIDKTIASAYKNITEFVPLGSQYQWLASLAKKYKNLELGVERPTGVYGGCTKTLKEYGGEMQFDSDGVGYISRKEATKDCFTLFGNYRFPIIKKNEYDMLCDIKKWGYMPIMKKVWYCHVPIKGKPCGLCNPCKLKIERGMKFLVPLSARCRYKRIKRIEKKYGNDRRIQEELKIRSR